MPNDKFSGQQLQRLESAVYVNGILLDIDHKESEASKHHVQTNYDMLNTITQAKQKLESVDDMIERSTSEVTPLATDVMVETFLINFASSKIEDIDGPIVIA